MLKPLLLAFLLSTIHAAEISVGIAALPPTTANHIGLPALMHILRQKLCKRSSGGIGAVNHIKILQEGNGF